MLKFPKNKKIGLFKTDSLIKISQHLLLSLAFESEPIGLCLEECKNGGSLFVLGSKSIYLLSYAEP